MKASELRIGNYVNLKKAQKPIRFKSFLGLCNVESHSEDFEPIPLTEEWLLKFGFKIKKELSPIKSKVYYLSDLDMDFCFYYADFRDDYGLYVEYTDSPMEEDTNVMYPVSFGIKYVHQIQNLFYALSGNELTIE